MDISKFPWSEERPPNKEIPYDHVVIDTPLGKGVIEWKSWKQSTTYTVYIGDEYVGNEVSLEDAMKLVIDNVIQVGKKIDDYLYNEQKQNKDG